MTDLWGIVIPILVAVVLSVGGSIVVSRSAAGPAQMAYVQALQARLNVVEAERDDAQLAIPKLDARIEHLETRVRELPTRMASRLCSIIRSRLI